MGGKLFKENKGDEARKFDMIIAQLLLVVYVLLNIWFIWQAYVS